MLYQKFIKDNFEYVGDNFAYEARSIHYNTNNNKYNPSANMFKDIRYSISVTFASQTQKPN